MSSSLAFASVGLLVGPLQSTESATPKIKVHYIDVGQGDAIYIHISSGEEIVMGVGNKGKGGALVAYLKKQKVDYIEMLTSTHPDADLIGRLDEFLDLFKVKSVYDPKVKHTTQAYKDLLLSKASRRNLSDR